MQIFVQITIGLTTASLAFLLGLLWQRIKKTIVNYRARRFWHPVISEDMQLVIGRFRGLQGFEASGMIGGGDALAMYNLCEYFERIGFGRFRISYNDQLGYSDAAGESLRTNLILLGGPDANSLTYDIVKRLSLGIDFKEIYPTNPDELLEPRIFDAAAAESQLSSKPSTSALIVGRILHQLGLISTQHWRTPVFFDITSKKLYQPSREGDKLLTDCGAIIRAPNPFDPTKTVVLLCGSYGYGTWAAVQLAQGKDFLRQVPRGSEALECVFQVDVVRDTPQCPNLEFVRRSPSSRLPVRAADLPGRRNF